MNRTEAIQSFLKEHAPADLAMLYHHDLECQVNVLPRSGVRVTGTTSSGHSWHGWRDEVTGEVWKEFRIPWGNLTYVDKPMGFSLELHAEAIGLTGWDWAKRVSRWVGFDFDTLVGHVKGLTDAELNKVLETCQTIPWVTSRRSKSGKGLHLYVFLDPPVPTNGRQEHAAVAKAVLARMAGITGLDLQSQVDKLGGNLWVWHRDTKPGGLAVINRGIPYTDLPANWRDNVPVVEGKRSRLKLPWAGEAEEAGVEDLVGKTRRVPLDDEHRRLLGFLATTKANWWWDQERHMLVCHTSSLKAAHGELKLKGLFYSNSQGKDPNDQNCFAFPAPNGAWAVRRHGVGTLEHPAWDRDPKGWTRCTLNAPAELRAAGMAHGGLEDKRGAFCFQKAALALLALKDLGAFHVPEVPVLWSQREASLLRLKSGKVLFSTRRESQDPGVEGWLANKKGDAWECLVGIDGEQVNEVEPPDELLRHVVAMGEDAGWYLRSRGAWVLEPKTNVVTAMIASGVNRNELDVTLGQAVLNHWELVNVPFEDEYPGNRRWNKDAARLAFTPGEGTHPTWNAILNHVGHHLNDTVRLHPWCKQHGLASGRDYLLHWVASLIQEPLEPLPYLFLYSGEATETGKSTFHEMLRLLFTRGCVRADKALTNPQGFNGELAGAVLAVVEETNVRHSKMAADRIKDWVTGRTILIHPKTKTPYEQQNATHWVQCSNPADYCPILPGDTRITMIYVAPFEGEEVPKHELMPMLKAEAPAFLSTVKRLDLPPPNSRLRIPVLETQDKREQQAGNRTDLQAWLEDFTFMVPGQAVRLQDLYEAFMKRLPSEKRVHWVKRRFSRELPPHLPRGRYTGTGDIHVGNISLEQNMVPGRDPRPLVLKGERLALKGE